MSRKVWDKFPTLQYLIKFYITWGVTNELLAGTHLSRAAVHLAVPDDAGKANKAHYFLSLQRRWVCFEAFRWISPPRTGDKFLPVSVSWYLVAVRTLNSLKIGWIIITWLGERAAFSVLLTTFTRNFASIYHSHPPLREGTPSERPPPDAHLPADRTNWWRRIAPSDGCSPLITTRMLLPISVLRFFMKPLTSQHPFARSSCGFRHVNFLTNRRVSKEYRWFALLDYVGLACGDSC